MTHTPRKSAFTSGGDKPDTLEELLGFIVSASENLAKAEGAEALDLAHAKAQEFLARARSLIEDLEKTADEVHDKARDAAHEVSSRARSSLEDTIRERPLLALSLAVAAGFLVGCFSRRSS